MEDVKCSYYNNKKISEVMESSDDPVAKSHKVELNDASEPIIYESKGKRVLSTVFGYTKMKLRDFGPTTPANQIDYKQDKLFEVMKKHKVICSAHPDAIPEELKPHFGLPTDSQAEAAFKI